MNFSECISPEEELIHKKIKCSVNSILQRIFSFEKLPCGFKKSKDECLLCTENITLHNVHDLTRIYSLILSCLKNHCAYVLKIDIEDIFVLEAFLLNFINLQENIDIDYLLKYNNNSNEIRYKESLKEQLVAIFNSHYDENIFKINCEQEIESLTYFYCKRLDKDEQNDLIFNYLLVIFFIRREYYRFKKVFSQIKKTRFNIKLAILFEIIDDNEKSLSDLCNELEICVIDGSSGIKPFLISLNGKHNFDFTDIIDLFKPYEDMELWIESLKSQEYWRNCVKLWAHNRSDNSSYVDNSMIDICIKYKKFDEAWNIFENINCLETSNFLRGVTLCCAALKNSNHCKWKKRLVNTMELIFENIKSLNFDNILENFLTNIENLSVSLIIRLINELQTHLIKIQLSEAQIECLFNFYNIYCYGFQNTELNKTCCTNAIYLYNKWNRTRTSKLNFFKKKTEYDTKIYSHMLGLCDIAKNCDFFNKVCKDLLKNGAHISRDLCRRLENFHSKNCENCEFRKKQIVTVKESRGFISHLFK